MTKRYESIPEVQEFKKGPRKITLNNILNYSKSIQCKKIKDEVVLLNLN